jgi:hypothetical protein
VASRVFGFCLELSSALTPLGRSELARGIGEGECSAAFESGRKKTLASDAVKHKAPVTCGVVVVEGPTGHVMGLLALVILQRSSRGREERFSRPRHAWGCLANEEVTSWLVC